GHVGSAVGARREDRTAVRVAARAPPDPPPAYRPIGGAGGARRSRAPPPSTLRPMSAPDASTDAPLAPFSAPTRAWFEASFAAPTPVQAQGWARIAAGEHALLLAPTGSGKTL